MSDQSNITSRILTETQLSRAQNPGAGVVIALLGALIASALYLLTLSNGLGWHDSAELALRADQLGATHSPGSPLHTLLGWVFVQFADSPAAATNVLSALSMGLAAGLVAMLAWQMSGRLFFAAAFVFACSFQVWTNAVITELYGLSALFSLLSCVFLWQWHALKKSAWLIAGIFAYCLALATWFANLLLAPALLWLCLSEHLRWRRNILVFGTMTGLAIVLIIGANMWLSERLPPYGPDVPDSIIGVFRYMSGAMHEPLAVRDAGFFAGRLRDHFMIFSQTYLWIGVPFGLLGLFVLVRADKVYGAYLAALFAIHMLYFTVFGAGDYYSMVILSYAIFSIWIILGAVWLSDQFPVWRIPAAVLVSLMPVLQAYQQLPQRIAARDNSPTQEFVNDSFAVIPPNALIIAGWQQFTALEYGQKVQDQRPDLQIVLPAKTVRHYGDDSIANYLDHIAASYCSRPILTNKVTPELQDQFQLIPLAASAGWFRVVDEEADCTAAS